MSPNEILAEMAERYASLSSYQDSGVVVTHLPDIDSPHERRFSTLFKRSGYYRFEWVSPPTRPHIGDEVSRCVIGCNGTGSKYAFYQDGEVEKMSLDNAVASATGISGGSANTIASLLSRKVKSRSIVEMIEPSALPDEEFEGVDCYRLTGVIQFCGPCELWIGKEDFLLRKMVEGFQSAAISEEIRRDIRTNEPIPSDQFKFDPPALSTESV